MCVERYSLCAAGVMFGNCLFAWLYARLSVIAGVCWTVLGQHYKPSKMMNYITSYCEPAFIVHS